jgi:AcrR family transcriptional regulator
MKEASRQKILRAAFDAFAENGYEKTTMDDIVKRSGLSKGTLYWHFKNKRELFIFTIMASFQVIDDQLAMLVTQDAPAADRIRVFFGQAGEFMVSNQNMIGLLIDAIFQAYQDEDSKRVMRDLYGRYINSVEQIIQQGIERGEFREVDPHMAAIALMAGGDGVAFYTLLEPAWDVPHAINMLADLILRGLKKE